MFSDFVRLISRRSPVAYERSFVRKVRVGEDEPSHKKVPRNLRVERVIAIGWMVIVVKSLAVVWLFDRYRVPVNPLWVIAPTVIFAALCTVVYLLRD